MIRLSLLAIAAALCLAQPAIAQTTTTRLAGVGDSEERPTGAWALPQGVELARPIKGYSVFSPGECEGEEARGSGDLVRLCIGLRHTGERDGAPYSLPITVEIPAGLIFVSDDLSTQNGIILKRFSVEVQPGRVVNVPAYMMCLNDNRSGSHPAAVYQLGPVLQSPAFNAFFKKLERKRLPQENTTEIQAAVWELAEDQALSPRSEAYVEALPDE